LLQKCNVKGTASAKLPPDFSNQPGGQAQPPEFELKNPGTCAKQPFRKMHSVWTVFF